MSSNCDASRVDCRWKPLREGEMSPFKMLVALFIREVYAATERKTSEERAVAPKTLLLIYNLISAYDMDTFIELKSTLEKPIHSVRPEVIKKFNRIVSNLEPNNSYFLYELANSIVTMEASQMVVLKKKISKNSPFGKFLRGIYLNVKKLSYPQVDFMYKQLLNFLGIIPGEGYVHSQGKSAKDKDKVPRVLKGLDLFQKLEDRKNGDGLDLELFHTYMMEYKKMVGSATESESVSYEIHSDWKAAKAKNATERAGALRKLWLSPQPKTKTEKDEMLASSLIPVPLSAAITPIQINVSDDDIEDRHTVKSARRSPRSQPEVSVKRITRSSSSPIGKGGKTVKRRSSSLRRIYFSSPRPSPRVGTPGTNLPNNTVIQSPGRTTRSSVAAAASKSPFGFTSSPLHLTTPSLPKTEMKSKIVDTGAFKIRMKVFPELNIPARLSVSKSGDRRERPQFKKDAMTMVFSDDDLDEDVLMQSLSPLKHKKISSTPSPKGSPWAMRKNKTPTKPQSGDIKLAVSNPCISTRALLEPVLQLTPLSQAQLTPVQNRKIDTKVKFGSGVKSNTSFQTRSSTEYEERWNIIKRWSRKQIERAIKSLVERLYSANCGVPNPSEITEFIRLALTNPSGSVLFPHLHYLEYLNCLRIKDVTRCTDSLRASFDVRIKPNTTELNKGTTYAAYNAALLYHQLGYKEDAMSSLDEAFRSGHAAGDATCLHHCHNLWSCFHDKAYIDAIVTVTKEVDNNMAYLHSLNVIVNAFDVQSQGVSPDEVLHSLWHYNADCDLEEMEGLLLSALSNFYTIFGWHEMVAFPVQMILYTNWKWSSRFYAFALSSLSQCLLYHGDVQASTEIMEYGQGIFGFDASSAGQSFILQHAIFKAIQNYLAYEPVSNKVLATILAFDSIEGVYWKGYNLMVRNNLKNASNLLSKFVVYLDDKQKSKSYLRTDLKLRCLLLLAELECLCRNPAGSMTYLSDALDIATTIHSDVYTTLCLFYAAAVQCEIGLEKTGALTIEKKMRSAIRSTSPWLTAKMNVIKTKIRIKVEETVTEDKRLQLMAMLDESEQLYKKWGNNYRLKEVLNLKAELIDRSNDLETDGAEFMNKLSDIITYLKWSKDTCIL